MNFIIRMLSYFTTPWCITGFFQENEPIPHASFNEKQMFILSFLDWLLYNKHEIDSYINERIFTKEEDHVSTICTDIFSLSRNPFSNHRLLSKCFCPFKYSRNCIFYFTFNISYFRSHI